MSLSMQITPIHVTVEQVHKGFEDLDEEGITGLNGHLDIRPKYQREFVYNHHDAEAVIHTILSDYPLNVMYWVSVDNKIPKDPLKGHYEILDGQQRTLSFCKFMEGDFHIGKGLYYDNMQPDVKEAFKHYPLLVYVCLGKPSEKLKWFRTINIVGKPLTNQELLDATYAGTWTSSAKAYFSKSNGPAHRMAGRYLTGSAIRQDYLETALKWICEPKDITVEQYMGKHEFDSNADELWLYFRHVFDWVKHNFKYRRPMKGVQWGVLYNHYKDKDLNRDEIEKKTAQLMSDLEVTNKKGIYPYLLDGQEKHLSLRQFSPVIKRSIYEKQKGICPICHKHYSIEEMDADHIIPWSKGGKTVESNCQLLCHKDNLAKSNR